MWPEETVSCCPLGGETPHPMCPSAGVWRPVGAREHAAAVPCLPLGYGDPSQGLDIVWASVEMWLAIWLGEPRDLGLRGQVSGLFLRRVER